MINLELVTLVLVVMGLLIVAVTFVSLKRQNRSEVEQTIQFNEHEFERLSEELNDTALDIYKELDDKYKEILVIYNLIEKKHQEIKNTKVNVDQDFQNIIEAKKHEIKNKNYETMKIKAVSNHIPSRQPTPEKFNTDVVALKVLNQNIKAEKSKGLTSKQEEVNRLLSRGFNVEQIAKEMNIGVGEVQLIKELLKVKHE